jgi:hypothetical protein
MTLLMRTRVSAVIGRGGEANALWKKAEEAEDQDPQTQEETAQGQA